LTSAAIALSPWTLPFGIFIGLLALVGFWGVNIADGGLLPGLGVRILHGEVPHADFMSPMPVGGAVLHLVDFALPLPLVLATKVVTIAEYVAIGVLFSLFVYAKRLGNLSIPESAGVVVAVLVGLHQFPVISFYTIDGLVFIGAAFVLVQRALHPLHMSRLAWAFGFLGVATTTKQSFWFAPFFVFVWVMFDLAWRRTPTAQLVRVAGTAVAATALAPLAYVLWVSAAGGFGEMWAELTNTTRVYGQGLLTLVQDAHSRSELLRSLAPLAVCVAAVQVPIVSRRLPAAVDVAARALATLIVLHVTLQDHLSFKDGGWALRLFWCVVAVTVIRSIGIRRIDVVGVAIAVTCWMVTLSYGAPSPALAAGAAAVYIANAIWRGAPAFLGSRTSFVYALGAIVGAAIVVAVSIHVRTRDDYGVARGAEVWSLGGELAGVKMDAATASYLADARECLAKYPAKWSAVLPEGALADAVYHLRNPLPLDWLWPPDYNYGEGRKRRRKATTETNERGDYVLLFQTSAFGFPVIHGAVASFIHDPPLGPEITSRLTHAQRHECGEFIAFYDPS
jgi:hypothetical protein